MSGTAVVLTAKLHCTEPMTVNVEVCVATFHVFCTHQVRLQFVVSVCNLSGMAVVLTAKLHCTESMTVNVEVCVATFHVFCTHQV